MTSLPQWNAAPEVAPSITHDAIVIVPGIMGSELVDISSGKGKEKVLWGLARPGWLAEAWLSRTGLEGLHLTPEEAAGQSHRVEARRLLRTPAWTPFLRGIEPYTKLINDVKDTAAHPDAVLAFPYDWRLSVDFNARRLAREARAHLEMWRGHSAHAVARRQAVDEREARLVFIAHSMGGLVTHGALTLGGDSDLAADTRGVMTLGTPFHGSVAAAGILNGVQGAPLPLPHAKLAALAATMPGVHDLLPRFLCLEDGPDVRTLSPGDVAALGGDKDLAAASGAYFDRLYARPLPQLRPVVGIRQDTAQSLRLVNGVVHPADYCFRTSTDPDTQEQVLMRDQYGRPQPYRIWGDGTVHRASAALTRRTIPLALQHGTLASSKHARQAIVDFLLEDEHLGPDQAGGALGLTVPDYVTPDTEWQLAVTGTDSPAGVDCTITAVDGTWSTGASLYAADNDTLAADVRVPAPGLYRLTVEAPRSPTTLTQMVMAGPAGMTAVDE
jgi:hypothetical protein